MRRLTPSLKSFSQLDVRSLSSGVRRSLSWGVRAASIITTLAVTDAAVAASFETPKISAAPSADGVAYDEGGMPRCIENPASHDALVFFWDESNPYPKKVYAAAMSDLQTVMKSDYFSRNCSLWPQYREAIAQSVAFSRQSWIVPAGIGATGFRASGASYKASGASYKWTPLTEQRLAAIRLGANAVHPGANAAEFLTLQPIANYTREYNRALSKAYGAGFSGDVYKEWLAHQPGNAALKTKIDQSLSEIQRRGTSQVSQLLKNYKIMVAEGYLQSPSSDRLAPLTEIMAKLGADVIKMSSDTVGPIAANATGFKAQIARELRTGSKLILISASKGAPEVLTALGELAQENPERIGQITAVITIAGMIEGSFLVDWADQFPIDLIVKSALASSAKTAKLQIQNLTGFFDMSTESLAKQSQFYRKRLPDLRYYNFVGVLTGDGLARDPEIHLLQERLSIPHISNQGGNDGYIEYPGTRFPRSWGLHSRDVVFEASHAILDGSFDGHSMSDPKIGPTVVAAIFQAVLQDASSRL